MSEMFTPAGPQPPVVVTAVALEMIAHSSAKEQILDAISWPKVPTEPMNEHELLGYLADLTSLAADIVERLRALEVELPCESSAMSLEDRVQLHAISDGHLVGRVNGRRQIFSATGLMVSDDRS